MRTRKRYLERYRREALRHLRERARRRGEPLILPLSIALDDAYRARIPVDAWAEDEGEAMQWVRQWNENWYFSETITPRTREAWAQLARDLGLDLFALDVWPIVDALTQDIDERRIAALRAVAPAFALWRHVPLNLRHVSTEDLELLVESGSTILIRTALWETRQGRIDWKKVLRSADLLDEITEDLIINVAEIHSEAAEYTTLSYQEVAHQVAHFEELPWESREHLLAAVHNRSFPWIDAKKAAREVYRSYLHADEETQQEILEYLANWRLISAGVRPQTLLPILPPREANRYILQHGEPSIEDHLYSVFPHPWQWVLRDLFEDERIGRIPSREVFDWLYRMGKSCLRREALLKERRRRSPEGVAYTFRYIDLVDEPVPDDLQSSIHRTFERAIHEREHLWVKKIIRDTKPLAPLPSWWQDYPGIRPLLTRADLVQEGREMMHCVGSYSRVVENRECVIVSIKADSGARSTASLDYDSPGTVLEHRGPSNKPPAEECQQILDEWLEMIYNALSEE